MAGFGVSILICSITVIEEVVEAVEALNGLGAILFQIDLFGRKCFWILCDELYKDAFGTLRDLGSELDFWSILSLFSLFRY